MECQWELLTPALVAEKNTIYGWCRNESNTYLRRTIQATTKRSNRIAAKLRARHNTGRMMEYERLRREAIKHGYGSIQEVAQARVNVKRELKKRLIRYDQDEPLEELRKKLCQK